jgi:hypothetical protein
MSALEEFKCRLPQEWLIPFCKARGYSHEGFDGRTLGKVSPVDATDFMQAIDSGLVHHRDGTFLAAQSKAKEQIFWEGAKGTTPRRITLWLEPIITIAGLLRLRRDHLWPASRLGLQSKTWAFDLVGYAAQDSSTEHLVCEVKKAKKEIDTLLQLMHKHLATPAEMEKEFKAAERNAFRKVLALRSSDSKVFWALGPDDYEFVFDVIRNQNGTVSLRAADRSALAASG